MIGNFKIVVIMIFILFCSCKKQNKEVIGRELIIQNINVLLDSIDSFDVSKMPLHQVSIKDFKNYKPVKIEQIKIGILDSILIEDDKNFLKFNLQKSDLVNFKSEYKISIVKVNNYDIHILFVRFSNFNIEGNKASIEVTKTIGISMLSNKYYFEKQNGTWVFKKKEFLGMG